VISQVFGEPVLPAPLVAQETLLEALQGGITGQLVVLDDASLTGTGRSSADVLGVPSIVVAQTLTGHLIREILARGSRGGPLTPLADQLNHDVTHLQGQRLEAMLGQLADEIRDALAPLGRSPAAVTGEESARTGNTSSGGTFFEPAYRGRESQLTAAGLPAGDVTGQKVAGHVFISYVREDSDRVDQLQRTLQAAGIPVWRDTADLWPGEDWRAKIRRAITDNALVFLACYSDASLARSKSYQNEELTLAVEQLRLRRPDDPWLIPVRFDECEIPDRDIGGGRTLSSIQRADLFGDRSGDGAARLVGAILRILQGNSVTAAAPAAQPGPIQAAEASGMSASPRSAGNSLRSAAAVPAQAAVEAALPEIRGRRRIVQGPEKLEKWLGRAPQLESSAESWTVTYEGSIVDLAALCSSPVLAAGDNQPTGDLPWFMTTFGRYSIIGSLQALPFIPQLAAATLRVLGAWQGSRVDDFRDEDPGRILHELRYGEMSAFEKRPDSPYYGSADATPLYVVLLDEYERWSGDSKLVRDLEPQARAALAWIGEYADLQHNGYVSYQRRNEETGLENQCWKDSWDSISYHGGALPGYPRATCELQGYAYDAKVRGARLARRFWHDPAFADQLDKEAADLKRRFNRDFWVKDRGYFAIALDTDGGQVDSLTSNIGHLLWSGIVDKSKARAVVRHLMSPRLFSGWGVRTLADGEGRYNPIGYHVGAVWPFDNSIIAWGLRNYGFKDEAARIAEGIFDAAEFFEGRLPEAFGGYPQESKYPVECSTACSPQAWSIGAPLLLLRAVLGLEPDGDNLKVDPALPLTVGWLELLDIPGRWGRIDAFGRGRVKTSRR
jgi:glycogen debranching enzyme